ncbi:MAG: IS4 family transposase, partial [Planctomycetota bacterium]
MDSPVPEPCGVPLRVEQVKGLRLVTVSSKDDELFRTWDELMLREHPLHDCRLVGRQLRYLIGSDHGWLGAIGFGSCALRLKVRDEWIGWDGPTRKAFQDRLINMTRFLIRPQVRCENLASRVLSMCMERVRKDFAVGYGFEPWLVESFVDRERYAGGCYRAANWLCVGATAGRGRSAPKRPVTTRKDLYLYELNRRWRRDMGVLTEGKSVEPISLQEAVNNDRWIEAEFGDVEFGHKVAEQRLVLIASAKAQNPSASYPECFAGNRHQLKAFYRFIGNERDEISPRGILQGHRKQTIRRIKNRKRVLVIQDTTNLDFSERLHCNGLGDIGKNQTGVVSQGLKMHSMLAVEEKGLPLGVLGTQIYASHFDSADEAQHRPIEEKESYRWLRTIDDLNDISAFVPETELIAVGDRESDIFEFFNYRRRKARNIHLLVRARYNRCLDDQSEKLFDHLQAQPVMGEAQIEIPRQRENKGKPSKPRRISLPARKARVQLSWDKVTVAAPATAQTRNLPAMELHALLAVEPDPPKGAKTLCWVLLTTVPIRSRKQALRCLRWYTLRWRIEEWHRVLKSGCHIESHQHKTAEKLARAIAIDTVIAWRVMTLTLLGREVPEIPCELIFSPWECSLLEQLQPLLAP